MAKTAKLKKKQATLHSRAARRAVSPTDPSIAKATTSTQRRPSASPPVDPGSQKPYILAAQNAGIQKRSKGKPLTRAQRQRQLKGMERAAHNMDKLEVKVAKSVGKEKKVKERSKGWEEVNFGQRKAKKGKKGVVVDVNLEEVEGKGAKKWEFDEEMEDGAAQQENVPVAVSGEVKEMNVVVPESVPLPAAELEDELL